MSAVMREPLAAGRRAEIRAYRRTGHGIVTITSRRGTRRYRVTLARLYWLRFWLIICNPWRSGGFSGSASFDWTLSDELADDNGVAFRRRQWRDFHRRNWKRLPRRSRS